jgi:hypothetical protein
MKKRGLKAKKLRERRRRLISTNSKSAKSAVNEANLTDAESLARSRAEARARVTQPNDASVPPSVSVEFREGHASPEGFVHTDPEGEHPNVREFVWKDKVFTRGADETFASFQNRICDALPVGEGPHILVFRMSGAAHATNIRQRSFIATCDVDGVIEAFQNHAGESEADFEARMRGRWGQKRFGTCSWPSSEPCPYAGPLAQVAEMSKRLGFSE